MKSTCLLSVLLIGAGALAAQNPTEQEYESSLYDAINGLEATLTMPPTPPPKIIFGANLVAAYGTRIDQPKVNLQAVLDYIDGLKAAGVQRVEFNPGVDSMFQPNTVALYDAIVQHIRQLGMQLAINPEYEKYETSNFSGGPFTSFQDFQTQQWQNYQMLASRYQPDNFVIVHEPDTMIGRLGVSTTNTANWDTFVAGAVLIVKAASPHTRVGAGCAYNTALNDYNNEDKYFNDFANNYPACSSIPAGQPLQACLDFLTMDIYSTSFSKFEEWAQLAHSTGKGVYIEEVWAPQDLPNPVPPGTGLSLDQLSLMGPVYTDFQALDASWLQAMVQFASYYGMESVTPFTTEAFFYYGTQLGIDDKASDPAYWPEMVTAIENGQLTATGQAWLAERNLMGIPQATSLNSAGFPTLPTVFDPTCGTGANPCNAVSTVAPDALVSAFGADLANTTLLDGTFPTTLGGTTVTMVDSSNTTYRLPLYTVVNPDQVNYYVLPTVALGPATITVCTSDQAAVCPANTNGQGTVSTGWVLVTPVAPGFYTANQNGQGVASGVAVCSGTCAGWPNPIGNNQFYQNTFMAGSDGEDPVPLSVAAGDTVVAELFGTGIRHVSSTSAITATINGQSVPVYYAGPQNQYQGLDQVNLLIPSTLSGSGVVNVVVTVNDPVNNVSATFNTVTLAIQ